MVVQVQGMLNMMEVDTCYFAVWTPAQLHVERVARDTELWFGVMMPALLQFYRYTVTLSSVLLHSGNWSCSYSQDIFSGE